MYYQIQHITYKLTNAFFSEEGKIVIDILQSF